MLEFTRVCKRQKVYNIFLRNNLTEQETLEAETTKLSSTDGFEVCWDLLPPDFPHLRLFACSLATVFPGSFSVESDFSVLTFCKSDHPSSLADISVEGQFHACQGDSVQRLQALARKSKFALKRGADGSVAADPAQQQ